MIFLCEFVLSEEFTVILWITESPEPPPPDQVHPVSSGGFRLLSFLSLIERSLRSRSGTDSIRRSRKAQPKFTFLLWKSSRESVPQFCLSCIMAAAAQAQAQLHGSTAATVAYSRTRASSAPSSCRWPQSLLAASPKVWLGFEC